MSVRLTALSFLSILAVAVAPAALGQAPPLGDGPGVITAEGQADISLLPKRIRMTVSLQARDPDMEAALAALKTKREEALSKLATLGVVEDSIQSGDPEISQAAVARQRQMQAMLQQRLRGREEIAKRLAQKEVVVLSQELTAEWEIKGATVGEVLSYCYALTKRISAAKIAGEEEAEELSLEEQEILAEINEYGYGGEEQANPGDPQFVYVAALSDKQRSDAIAKAFAQARAQAELIAQATSAKLGEVRAMRASSNTQSLNPYDEYAAYRYARSGQAPPSGASNEAISPTPGKVKFAVEVRAAFAIEP
jgi:uncharacterized protein YggE